MPSIEAIGTNRIDAVPETSNHVLGHLPRCPLCYGTQILDFLSAPDRFHLRQEEYHLMRCSSCGCVWLASPPEPNEMSFHYGEDYHNAIVLGGEQSAEKRWQGHREVISRHKQGGTILDIGCSSGGFLGTMERERWELYGIEMEASTAERARLITGAQIFVGDALDAPFPAESFDVVTCFDVLEHVYDPRKFLARILGWLNPGGILYAKLPNIESWEAKLLGTYWYGLELPRHLYHFSPRSLTRLMTTVGFQEISIAATEDGSHFPNSARYIYEDLFQRFGSSPASLAKTLASGQSTALPWRVVRKTLQLFLVRPWGKIAASAGAGVFINVLARK